MGRLEIAAIARAQELPVQWAELKALFMDNTVFAAGPVVKIQLIKLYSPTIASIDSR